MGGWVALWHRGGIKRMRSKVSPCISSCRVVGGEEGDRGGGSPGEILKTKNAGEVISGHFGMRFKSQIYLNYVYLQMFQRKMSRLCL